MGQSVKCLPHTRENLSEDHQPHTEEHGMVVHICNTAMWRDGPLQLADQPPGQLVCSRINDSLCFKK